MLQVTTRALNGVFNRSSVGGRARGADPKFYPILDALRRLQLSGAVGLRLERRGQDETLRLILAGERSAEVNTDIRFVREALGVAPDARDEITVTFGAVPRTVNELAVLTRSMMEILIEVAQGIDVPPQDVAEGRTPASSRLPTAEDPRDRPILRVFTGSSRPSDAFAAIERHGAWFWIDDRDLASKRAFSVLMLFFSLAETGVARQVPVLTLPAN